jgi:hypothetical protein
MGKGEVCPKCCAIVPGLAFHPLSRFGEAFGARRRQAIPQRVNHVSRGPGHAVTCGFMVWCARTETSLIRWGITLKNPALLSSQIMTNPERLLV